jgi:hypothetical protein
MADGAEQRVREKRKNVRREDATSMARKYRNMVLGEKVHAAVRMVTNTGTGGVYQPFDLDSKSGRPVNHCNNTTFHIH